MTRAFTGEDALNASRAARSCSAVPSIKLTTMPSNVGTEMLNHSKCDSRVLLRIFKYSFSSVKHAAACQDAAGFGRLLRALTKCEYLGTSINSAES